MVNLRIAFTSSFIPVMLLAGRLLAAADESVDEAQGLDWLDIVSLSAVALVLIAVIVWVVVIARRFSDRRREEEREALQFEAQASCIVSMQEVNPLQDSKDSPAGAESAESQSLPAPTPPEGVAVAPATSSEVESTIEKLRAAGLFAGLEGRIFLSDEKTEATIVRLVGEKTALVLPYLESPGFLARQLKRFDLCIVPLAEGQICVLTPFGQYIADRVRM